MFKNALLLTLIFVVQLLASSAVTTLIDANLALLLIHYLFFLNKSVLLDNVGLKSSMQLLDRNSNRIFLNIEQLSR